jgi:two-component system sensor histidine kinase ChvG
MSSRIARLLFFWDFVGVAILAAGSLLLAEMRDQLMRARAESLETQGELIVNALADTATMGEPAPTLIERNAREVLRRLMVPRSTRVRLFANDGSVVADTDLLSDRLIHAPLPPIAKESAKPRSWLRRVTGAASFNVLPWQPTFSLDQEFKYAAGGERARGQRRSEQGERIVSVAIPVQHVQAVVGVLVLDSGDVEEILRAERVAMIPFIVSAAAISLLSSILLALLIAVPLRQLTASAERLRLGLANRLNAPPELFKRKDEIGDLAHALDRMTDALVDRIAANDRFAADVSHEIKNPLTSIRSAVETVRNVKDPAAQEKLLAIIAADVGRVDRLITDISRASRIEAETARGAPEPINLAQFLPDLVETYALTRRDDEVAVRFLGPAPAHSIVVGQVGPLGQVFRNLVDNAKSFSPENGDVTVRIEEHQDNGRRILRAYIEDAGPGIPSENLSAIFERFYTHRPKGGGSKGPSFGGHSGLGLSIAKAIVEAHKGRIWAENMQSDGQVFGARFIVELPAAPQNASQ